jgi:flagellar hook-associated protein 2
VSTPSSSTSGLNLSGLASGIDTSSIINQLMAIERQPRTRIVAKQATEDARQQALKDVQAKLQALQLAGSALSDAGSWGNVQTVDVNDPTKIAATYVSGTGPGGYTVDVSTLARAEQRWYTYTAPGSDDSITVGGHSTPIAAGSDINAAASAINSDAGASVYATAVTDGSGSQFLVLSSRTTGTTSAFTASGSSLAEDASKAVAGQDAAYTVNGVGHTAHSNVVTDGIPGLSMTLKGTTTASGPVTVSVGNPGADQSAIADKVKSFVTAYNDAITFISGKLAETKVFNPQTVADASKGVLHGDTGLESLLSQLRVSITGTYAPGNPATLDQLAEIGISTGSAVGSGTLNQDSIAGKLTLDVDKLTAALTSDPQSVRNLLGGTPGVSGFGQALDSLLSPQVQAGGTLAQRISAEDLTKKDLADQLAAMDIMLQQKQDLLKKQFTAMETAMSKSQSQGQWLTGQIASLPKSA